MGGLRKLVSGACALALGACTVPDVMDLAENPRLYRDSDYEASVGVDRTAFLAPVVDARADVTAADASSPFPVQRLADSAWLRTPARMVDDILRREAAASGVFTALTDRAVPDGCVIQAELREFDASIQEMVEGRRSLAAVRLWVRVHGPAGARGQRPVLFEQEFPGTAVSSVAMRPPSPRAMLGGALREAVGASLAAMDQANVGRAHVPMDLR